MALIYDVGMHMGEDTAFYLSQGHTVIGIEAVPAFAAAACCRFAEAIAKGQLTVLNVAIADHPGECDFWFCEDCTIWSSTDRRIASRRGARHQRITVEGVRFADILARHGFPHYLKIDIEGSDILCIQDLDARQLPPYISVESECCDEHGTTDPRVFLHTLYTLHAKGYRKFKLVSQVSLVPVPQATPALALDPAYTRTIRQTIEQQHNWTFEVGSSGPWGDAIPGNWMGLSDAVTLYRRFRGIFFSAARRSGHAFWCDWHACS